MSLWRCIIFFLFQTQAVSKKRQLLCIQQLRGTPYTLCLPVSPHFLTLFPCLLLSIVSVPLKTELCLGSLALFSFFIYIYILCHLKQTVYCCSTATPPPTETCHLRFMSGHAVLKRSLIHCMIRQVTFNL